MRIRQARALACVFAVCAAAAPAAPLSLAETLAAARDNLDVSLAARAVAAARGDVLSADHAPLPQLSGKLSQMDLQHGLGPGNWLADKRIDKSLGIDWTWERGDKRGLRTEAAQRAANAAAADLEDIRLHQAMAALGAYFDLLAAQDKLVEVQAIEASARELAASAERRRRAGDLATQDAARAAIEAERAGADSDGARADLDRAQLALAVLIGRERDAAELQARADWPAAPADEMTMPSLEDRADLRAAAERVQSAEAAQAGAAAQRQNDLTWGASIDHFPGTSTRQVELRVSMPLTWGYHYDGEVAHAQAQLDAARDQLDKTRRAADAELQALRAALRAAARRSDRYAREIVPRSRSVAERAELAYTRGAIPLSDLLDARRTLRGVLVEALTARADLAKAVGAWQLRTGALR